MTAENKINAHDALLDAAECLFADLGYSAVSTRDLAERAGVNLGAIQYHFGSKAQLFIKTIHRLMSRKMEAPSYRKLLATVPNSREEGALQLAEFIDLFIVEMCKPEGPQACRMMYREAQGETSNHPEMFEALVSSVVNDFIAPMDTMLRLLVRKIDCQANDEDAQLMVQSIIGQCSYYFTHRPFVERLRGESVHMPAHIRKVAKHIARTTLRALNCDEKLIESALKHLENSRTESDLQPSIIEKNQ